MLTEEKRSINAQSKRNLGGTMARKKRLSDTSTNTNLMQKCSIKNSVRFLLILKVVSLYKFSREFGKVYQNSWFGSNKIAVYYLFRIAQWQCSF